MNSTVLIFAIFSFRAVLVFANYWIAFDRFSDYKKLEWKNTNWLWIGLYAFITLAYRPMIGIYQWLNYIMVYSYLVRIVPFLWGKYGFNFRILVTVAFYENIIDCVAQNLNCVFLHRYTYNIYTGADIDISGVIAEIIVFVFLITLMYLKRTYYLDVWLTKLTMAEYILLFLSIFMYTLQETTLLKSLKIYLVQGLEVKNYTDLLKGLSVISFILLMFLVMHIIMVRKQNISMNSMIGNLKEPMKQIAASYIEMHEKNTELRRFRHDIKNLLLALNSMIEEKKYNQASDYIHEMQETMEVTKEKAFDTGNFIADALFESKAKTAKEYGIIMSAEGCIPVNKVEDVNMVILISNLVDNAIEAAKKVAGDKKIEIKSILKKNIWIFTVKNSCEKDVVIKRNHIETTKGNKDAHGFGLSNVERVTQKYDGKLHISCEDKVFTARATLILNAG